jgi:hypothetical protein
MADSGMTYARMTVIRGPINRSAPGKTIGRVAARLAIRP